MKKELKTLKTTCTRCNGKLDWTGDARITNKFEKRVVATLTCDKCKTMYYEATFEANDFFKSLSRQYAALEIEDNHMYIYGLEEETLKPYQYTLKCVDIKTTYPKKVNNYNVLKAMKERALNNTKNLNSKSSQEILRYVKSYKGELSKKYTLIPKKKLEKYGENVSFARGKNHKYFLIFDGIATGVNTPKEMLKVLLNNDELMYIAHDIYYIQKYM